MSPRARARLVWALVAVAAAFMIAGLTIAAVAYPKPHGETGHQVWTAVILGAILIPWGVVGGLVASRRPRNPIGWLFLVAALGMSITVLAGAYAEYSEVVGALPGDAWAAWVVIPLFPLSVFVVPVLAFLVFPDGHFLSRRWRFATIAFLVAASATFTAEALQPGPIEGLETIDNPIGVESTVREAVAWSGDTLLGSFVMAFTAAAVLVRLRRSEGEERAQIKWVVYAALVACIGFLATFLTDWSPAFILGLVGLAAIPVAAGIAMLKYHLYDIDRVVSRTLVYGALTALLAGLYFGIVIGLQAVFGGLARGNDLAIAGSTLAVAALFRPARAWIQAFVDRRFYRSRYDAARTLETFSARLRDEVDLDRLGTDLGGAVHETMQPRHVSLWLRPARVDHE